VSVRRELGSVLISDKTEYQLGQQVATQIDSTQKNWPTKASNATSSKSPLHSFNAL
jgi:hypothetical protein